MGRKIKIFLGSKVFKVSLLLALWLILTIWYVVVFDTSFSIWSYNHPNSDIKNLNFNAFYKGEMFKGQFKAQDNNLGIISIRFQTYIRPPYSLEDKLLFKLKERSASKWYYVNTYRSGLIYDVPFFPFGFPQIKDSKGKTYEFEITALNTNSVNRLSISDRYPVLQSKYKYSRKEMLQDKKMLIRFLLIKFTNAFMIPDVVFSSFVYLLPLAFYLAWISFLKKIFKPITDQSKKIIEKLNNNVILGPFIRLFKKIFVHNLDYFLVIVVFVDILMIQLVNDVVYVVILILWMFTLRTYGRSSKESFAFGLLLIALCPVYLMKGLGPTAEKSAVWAYLFLVAGMVQALIERKSER
jgi:hypothetical protein